jgi:hypothetical protein
VPATVVRGWHGWHAGPVARDLRGDRLSYAKVYGHDRTTVTTCISDTVIVCVLENILGDHEDLLIVEGSGSELIDGRVAFQTDSEVEFTAAAGRLTYRRLVAFVSANQTSPGVACERFFLDAAPLTTSTG